MFHILGRGRHFHYLQKEILRFFFFFPLRAQQTTSVFPLGILSVVTGTVKISSAERALEYTLPAF